MTTSNWLHRTSIALATVLGLGIAAAQAGEVTLTNVSYDPTRELYKAYDALFAKYWKEKTGDTVTIKVSNGGSGAQARAVLSAPAVNSRLPSAAPLKYWTCPGPDVSRLPAPSGFRVRGSILTAQTLESS